MLFLSANEAKAIEQVRYNMDDYTNPGSIIRHYDDGVDIVCYHNTAHPYFMMYRQGVPTTNELFLDPMDTVCDFEIYNDTVYFCGIMQERMVGHAVIGYFAVADLFNLNPSNVSYINLPEMTNVWAVEVGWFASRKHVVGVGESINSEGMMVDMIDEYAHWMVNFGDVGGDTVLLSDVAITQNYVVVTSKRNLSVMVSKGRLWYFEKPTATGNSIFQGTVSFLDNNLEIREKYRIRAIGGDVFITACHSDNIHGSLNPFVVSYYSGFTCNRNAVIDEGLYNFVTLGDISYTLGTNVVNLLLHGTYHTNSSSITRSVIYEIIYGALPSTVMAHVYDGVIFESLDRIWSINLDEQHLVSSGYMPEGLGTPYYLKYHSLYFDGSCLDKMDNYADTIKISSNRTDPKIKSVEIKQLPIVIEAPREPHQVDTKCISPTYPQKKEED
jgi:hypothetical protein